MNKRSLIPLIVSCLTAAAACGKKDDKKVDAPTNVYKANGATATATLTDAKVGDKFILLPYILGGDNVEGGDPDQSAGSFTVSAPGAKALGKLRFHGPTPANGLREDFEHMQRSILNRYDSRRGLNQGEGFWKTVDALDRADAVNHNFQALAGRSAVHQSLRQTLMAHAHQSQLLNMAPARHALPLTGDGCPAEIKRPDANLSAIAVNDADIVKDDQGSFCLVYLKAAPLVTETDKDKIKASVTKILERYKTIYADDFSKEHDSYRFKPVIVFLPFDNTNYWPQKYATILGAFYREMSTVENQPMLYMPVDVSKSSAGNTTAAIQKLTFHDTIAHEMQHAVMDYFKSWSSLATDADSEEGDGKRELLSYDEGLAHYFEDLMGYQEVSFSGYPKNFLLGVAVTGSEAPFLWNTSDGLKAVMRGANQCFFYYLASQAGGITFTDGSPSGGKGLDFIRALVKADGKGLANLKAAAKTAGLNADWVTLVGKYLGALMIDGSSTPTDDAAMKTQGPVGDVTNTIGDTGKTYGFTFAKDVGDISTRLESIDPANAADLGEQTLSYYMTRPILYEVADPAQPITINFKATYTNAAVAVVKVANGSN